VIRRVEEVGEPEHVHLGIEGAEGAGRNAPDGDSADLDLFDGHLLVARDLAAGEDVDLQGPVRVLVHKLGEFLVGQLRGIALGMDLRQLEHRLGLGLHGRSSDDAQPDQQTEYDAVQLHGFLLLGFPVLEPVTNELGGAERIDLEAGSSNLTMRTLHPPIRGLKNILKHNFIFFL